MGEQEGEEQDGDEGMTGQATVPNESQEDVYVNGFWKWSTPALLDI